MTYRELIAHLEAAGWRYHRRGKGAHMIYAHPDRKNFVVVAHGGKLSRDIPEGTKNAILKQAGLR